MLVQQRQTTSAWLRHSISRAAINPLQQTPSSSQVHVCRDQALVAVLCHGRSTNTPGCSPWSSLPLPSSPTPSHLIGQHGNVGRPEAVLALGPLTQQVQRQGLQHRSRGRKQAGVMGDSEG